MMIDAKNDRNKIHQHAGAELGQSHLKLELELSLAMETEILTLLKFQPIIIKLDTKVLED